MAKALKRSGRRYCCDFHSSETGRFGEGDRCFTNKVFKRKWKDRCTRRTDQCWALGSHRIKGPHCHQSEFPQVLQNFSVPGSAANYVAAMSELDKITEA